MDRKGDFISLGGIKDRFNSSPSIDAEGKSVRIKIADNANISSRIDGFNFEHTPSGVR